MTRGARLRLVSALGIIEILAWGSSFYLIAVLGPAIAAETGWSHEAVAGGVSVGLLTAGLSASGVGRAIQRRGGRPVLAAGLALLAAGLVLLGLARSLTGFYAAWAVLGLGMAGSLYDAAFSTLGRIFGRDARAAITHLTLWGGFASTVCWPLSGWMLGEIGWRGTCLAYAALHLTVSLPLALAAIPRAEPPKPPGMAAAAAEPVVPVTDPRFLALVLAGVTLTTLATIWSIHFVTLLGALGYLPAAAIAIGTLIGPSQVGARVVEMLGRGRHHPAWTMLAATLAVLAGFAALLGGVPAAAAMIAYGAGNGLWSIARGALPLSLFGPEGYARTMGRLATPTLLASALAPSLGAWTIARFGPAATMHLMAAAAVVPLALAAFLLTRAAASKAVAQV